MSVSTKQKVRRRSGDEDDLDRDGILDRDYVSAFARGLDLIKAFNSERIRMSVSEAAEATGLSRAAARRLLLTLVHIGYARQSGEYFSLTPGIMEVGYSFVASWHVVDIVRPELAKLVERYNENSSFGVLDRDEVVNVARVQASRIVRSMEIVGGSRTPVAVGSMGRILLAGLPEADVEAFLDRNPLRQFTARTVVDRGKFMKVLRRARKDGFCVVDGEFEEGLIAIGAPVRNRDGAVVAAINIGAPSARMSSAQILATLKDPLLRTAAEISRLLDLVGLRTQSTPAI